MPVSPTVRFCAFDISQLQLDAADRFYVAGDSGQAQAALVDVVAFSELARDYSIQSHKHEKQSEIAIRKMARKLSEPEARGLA
jgi:hypothetical protein